VTVDPERLSDQPEPFVVKARVHACPDRPGAPPRVDTNVVVGGAQARRRVELIRRLGAEPHVEEFCEGPLLAYSAVTGPGGGPVVADSMQVASRIWPPGAGASCRATTVAVDEELAARAADLFVHLGWFGLAELQFVRGRDGVPRVIDLNGRFYGSLSLAVAAGANLPAVWAALATGRPAPPARAQPGVRYQWLEADLRRAGRERRGGRARDVAGTAWFAMGAVHSIARAADPLPAALRVTQVLTGDRQG
jgi:predicted ATP-grasp superfamily ATP-dependent carboligase